MNHEITTAARRIAREINDTPKEYEVMFDKDGQSLGTKPAGMWYVNGHHAPEGTVYTLTGRKGSHITYQGVQDVINVLNTSF
ncbi:hypothetical protein [Lactiplantibacillus plantarum]|uniref:hypothetical protein n=1 Tax=Lactiplantibacillus plantarum TaxID=1590 RepID=UPI001AAEAAC1|nr:hypothetical protein [Lactiplantibacillus plantarum]MBO2705801.1 hypothetical protein [Lactiplantibacillus plantarum]MDN7038266.1 hypothetical protein [Lactiplantibacillus plantarum]MDO7795357.1 hypothetical protein [Lactiplantibacillus plantarum]WVI00461.1 hypothetical protein VZE42_07240 [Lactiplantibacillus plantarum]